MNDTIYNDILIHYVPHIYRVILQKKDYWLIPIKRIQFDIQYASLITDIILHTGMPCDIRYCACRYFSNKDKARYSKLINEFCFLYLDEDSDGD